MDRSRMRTLGVGAAVLIVAAGACRASEPTIDGVPADGVVTAAPGALAEPSSPSLPAARVAPPFATNTSTGPDRAPIQLPPGARSYRLSADSAVEPSAGAPVQLFAPVLVFVDSAGTELACVTAERGEVDNVTGAIIARGSVFVEIFEGERYLRTEELHYLPGADRVWSPVRSTFGRPGLEVCGERFTSDTGFRHYQVEGAVVTFDVARPLEQ
jgi:hypothetical protein